VVEASSLVFLALLQKHDSKIQHALPYRVVATMSSIKSGYDALPFPPHTGREREREREGENREETTKRRATERTTQQKRVPESVHGSYRSPTGRYVGPRDHQAHKMKWTRVVHTLHTMPTFPPQQHLLTCFPWR